MLDELIKITNELDSRGLIKEADYLDVIIKKVAGWMVGLSDAMFEMAENFEQMEVEGLEEAHPDVDWSSYYEDKVDAIQEIEKDYSEDLKMSQLDLNDCEDKNPGLFMRDGELMHGAGMCKEEIEEYDAVYDDMKNEWKENEEEFLKDYIKEYSLDQNATLITNTYDGSSNRGACYYRGSDGRHFTIELTNPKDNCGPPLPAGNITYNE